MPTKHDAPERQSAQIVSIQWLRALAALAVVAWHAEVRWRDFTSSGPAVHSFCGQAGVDLFFLISDFVMWLTVAGRPPTMGEFLRRRITRMRRLE